MRYRKKYEEFDGIYYDGTNIKEVKKFLGKEYEVMTMEGKDTILISKINIERMDHAMKNEYIFKTGEYLHIVDALTFSLCYEEVTKCSGS